MKKKIVVAGTLVTSFLFSGQVFASEYTVKSGDSLWKIAATNQVTVSKLKTWNSLSNDLIFPGQVLSLKSSTPGPATPAPAPSKATSIAYIIKAGDSLSKIAKNHHTTVKKLLALNPSIENENRIYVGQRIIVSNSGEVKPPSTPATTPSQPAPAKGVYTIRSGDSLSLVANRNGVPLSTILATNPTIKDPNRIYVGQVITIPSAGQTAPVNGDTTWQEKADAILKSGKKYIGASYLYGASTNRTDAFDCSSYTVKVFQENGINLPRTSSQQANSGTEIQLGNIRKGDLVFFDTNGDGMINHVSIVVDSNTLLHAASSTGVGYASYSTYWKKYAVKAVRVL